VGLGDPIGDAPETLVGDNLLGFAGIPPARVLAVARAQQFAEKLHAYTTPWTGRTNTRTKDLVDLVVLLERGNLDTRAVARAVSVTFERRAAHPLPDALDPPPVGWERDFATLTAQVATEAVTLEAAHALVAACFGRVRQIGEGGDPSLLQD